MKSLELMGVSLRTNWSCSFGFGNLMKARSVKNKESRAKQFMRHTTGTKSFARIREEAHLNEQISQETEVSEEEIFSRIMGKEKYGRVRTYGLGPSPTDIWGTTPGRAEALKIASEAQMELLATR
uniref:Uncharacterized protein n=1 Tax=Nelumbo nucifera TaxID=4432 RepID=A0A822XWG9_NELNU|nr:TPA_asm: hypothetical protein HUJ06_024964 [Nelumbo nucifera]